MTASKYSYLGGFTSTSNVLAGHKFGIPIQGTHAHSFVMSSTNERPTKEQTTLDGVDLLEKSLEVRAKLGHEKT